MCYNLCASIVFSLGQYDLNTKKILEMAKMACARADKPRVRYAEAPKEVRYGVMIGTEGLHVVVKLLI